MTTNPPPSSPTPNPSPSSSPSTPEPEGLTATPPGFKPRPQRSPEPFPGPDATPTTATMSSGELGALSDGPASAWPRELPGSTPPSRSSTPGSTADQALDLAAEEGYRKLLGAMAEQLVGLCSLLVRAIRARRRPLPEGVWIADRADKKAIGAPLARIAARHAPMSGAGSDDLVDGFTAGVAGVAYALKGFEAENDAIEALAVVEPFDVDAGQVLDDTPPAPGQLLADRLVAGDGLPPHLRNPQGR